MTCPIQLGAIGTSLEVTVVDCDGAVIPLNSATIKTIHLKGPDGAVLVSKTAELVTDGSDGKMHYVTLANDLNASGKWKIQGFVELPIGTWSTTIGMFVVADNLA